ncbi:MAG: glycosyltransferase family 2 protein [Terricaulis sp.]
MRRVSVIVPTRNRSALLRQALASIRAVEGDDLALEILVGDNGDAPETKLICEEFRAIHLPVTEHGASAARNAGLRAATGDYLAFLDDDDVWLPGHLRPQLKMLDERSDLEAVFAQVINTEPDLTPRGAPAPKQPGEGDVLLRKLLSGLFPQIGTLVTRVRVREKVGEFDPVLLGGQDLDWMLRIARTRRLGFVRVPSVYFRGRYGGTEDALQLRRIAFDRKVFFRHALPEWRIWSSPFELAKAHNNTLGHFYRYFSEAAEERAVAGQRGYALRTAWTAVSILPFRAAGDMFRASALRRALYSAARGARA